MAESQCIAERCKREIKNSRNLDQLEAALRYCALAQKQGHLTEEDNREIFHEGFVSKMMLEIAGT